MAVRRSQSEECTDISALLVAVWVERGMPADLSKFRQQSIIAGCSLVTPRLLRRGVKIRERSPNPLADMDPWGSKFASEYDGSRSKFASEYGPRGPILWGSKSAGTPEHPFDFSVQPAIISR